MIDLKSKKVVFERFEGEDTCPFLSEDEDPNETRRYDLLVGADGVNSEVRRAMEIFTTQTFTVKKHVDGMQYKSDVAGYRRLDWRRSERRSGRNRSTLGRKREV